MRPDDVAAVFSPQRLRLARYRAGLTVRELAERVGVTHAAISQYENGRNRPTGVACARLALATGVGVQYFASLARTPSDGAPDGAYFRSLRSTTRQHRSMAWAWAEAVLDVTAVLERHVRLPDPSLPDLAVTANADRTEMETAARELRRAWQVPPGPLGHVVRHLEAHGLVVARLPIVDAGIDAFSHAHGHRPVVVLGTGKDDAARSRFDAAHELAHLVCHPEADPGSSQEQQAHAFAAELLMPRQDIIGALPRRFDLGAYATLKHTWGVSIAALLYRARTLDVISEAAHRRAVVTLNQRYGRRNEPYPLPAAEAPALLAAAADLAAKAGHPLQWIADEAGLSLADTQAIVGTTDPRPELTLT
jgi:Zn-dependent peptidase ImmA (M78 family)/transcriptional regulator with XRE-family HTH domain